MDLYLQREVEYVRHIQQENVLMAIVNADGGLIISTDAYAQSFGLANGNCVFESKPLNEFTIEDIRQIMPDLTDTEHSFALNNLSIIYKIWITALRNNIIISFLDYTPYNKIREIYLGVVTPIIGENKSVVGLRLISSHGRVSLFGRDEFFSHLVEQNRRCDFVQQRMDNYPQLSRRQAEILYFLANGFSQTETAQILNMSRGALANIVSEQICPKFNIYGSNTKKLIQVARKLHLDIVVPASLSRPFIFILDQEISERYFTIE